MKIVENPMKVIPAPSLPKILICDDDALIHIRLKHDLKESFQWFSAYNGDEALVILKSHTLDAVLLDIKIRSPQEGLEFIPRLIEQDPDLAIVMSSAYADFSMVKQAMRLGASDYIIKNTNTDELVHTLHQALERRNLLKRQRQQNFESWTYQKQQVLIGESPCMKVLRLKTEKLRNSSANIVITGETGTGKELVARQLRKCLPEGTLEPFLAVDSSTIQSSMAESMLFGHEKGAFTGADKTTKGIFEEANSGVVYFDEVSNMPLPIQVKLLRVLQEKEITRVGSSKAIQLDFRVICATNRNLEGMVAAGEFKQDLLQRLNVIPILVPSLRERTEDIPVLIGHFIQKQTYRQSPLRFSERALTALKTYSWPGNIRELENLITQLSTLIEGEEVDFQDLPERIQKCTPTSHVPAQLLPNDLISNSNENFKAAHFYQKVKAFESSLLMHEYTRHQGNMSQLATHLGMDRSHLYSKLKAYGIYSPKTKTS